MPARTNIVTVRKLHGHCFLAELACEDLGVDVREVSPESVLKHILGKAPHDRKERKLAVLNRALDLGWEPQDDNAAGAIAILDYAAHCYRVPEVLQGRMFGRHFEGEVA